MPSVTSRSHMSLASSASDIVMKLRQALQQALNKKNDNIRQNKKANKVNNIRQKIPELVVRFPHIQANAGSGEGAPSTIPPLMPAARKRKETIYSATTENAMHQLRPAAKERVRYPQTADQSPTQIGSAHVENSPH